LGRVAQHLVGLGRLLELGLGLGVADVPVGVILHGQLAVGPLDLLVVGLPRDAEDLVIIPLGGHTPLPRNAYRIAPATLLLGSSSSTLVTITSVVSIKPAMLAAFCRAERVTLVGSTMPALNMSTNSPVLALYPQFGDFSPFC